MRGNLLRYAIWQLRDFARERGIALMVIGLAVSVTFIGPMKAMSVQFTENSARQLIVTILSQVALLAAFISFNGMISNDRKLGYFRFLFSKPVSIPAYYTQLFAVFFVGYLTVFAILLALFGVVVFPVFPIGVIVYAALVFLSLGGIAFFISSLVRFDWPALGGVFLGTLLLRSVLAGRDGLAAVILAVLPPIHELLPLASVVTGGAVAPRTVIWLLGYSAFFFAAGLIVLRRRPFA